MHMCPPLLGAASCSPYFGRVFALKSLSVADEQMSPRTCLHEHLLDRFRLAVCLFQGGIHGLCILVAYVDRRSSSYLRAILLVLARVQDDKSLHYCVKPLLVSHQIAYYWLQQVRL